MGRPLSNDLRERVVGAVLAGESCRAVAARFGVAVSSVVKWSQRQRATGSVAPGKMGGHRKPVLEPSFLNDLEVRKLAGEFGDPDEVLAPVSHAAHGSGTLW